MKKVICIVCFALLTMAVSAQDLNGSWTLMSIQLEEVKIGETVKKMSLSLSSEFVGNELLPNQFTFNGGVVTYVYANGEKKTVSYTLKNEVLEIDLVASLERYIWQIDKEDDSLDLIINYERADSNYRSTTFSAKGFYKRNK